MPRIRRFSVKPEVAREKSWNVRENESRARDWSSSGSSDCGGPITVVMGQHHHRRQQQPRGMGQLDKEQKGEDPEDTRMWRVLRAEVAKDESVRDSGLWNVSSLRTRDGTRYAAIDGSSRASLSRRRRCDRHCTHKTRSRTGFRETDHGGEISGASKMGNGMNKVREAITFRFICGSINSPYRLGLLDYTLRCSAARCV